MPLEEARVVAQPAPPLQRDDVEAPALEAAYDLARPLLGRARRALGLGNERPRPEHGVPVAEEGVGVGHAVVRAAGDPEHGLAAPDVRERECETVDLDPVEARDDLLRLLGVPFRVRTADEPPAVLSALGGPQRRVREDVVRAHGLAAAERLEDGAPGELGRRVAEHRPVRDLARGRAPGADRVEDAARAARAEAVEVRRRRGLVAGATAEDVVRAVAEPVEEDHDDRQHAASLTRGRG